MSILRFEHRSQPLASRRIFFGRLASHGGAAVCVLLTALAVGMAGYRLTEGMSWLDAFLNASMILGGMGPVAELRTSSGKLFAGAYAIFSGVLILLVVGILLAPLLHRLMHRLHLEKDKGD